MPCGLFHGKYVTDEAIFPTLWLKRWMVFFGVFLILLPIFSSNRIISFLIISGIFIIGGHGLNILTGFTGQISIGHGAFMAVGASTSGIVMTKLGLPFLVALPSAGVVTAIVGMIFGVPSFRVRGLYLALATLAAQFIIEFAVLNFKGLTGGASGMFVPKASIFGFELDTEFSYYYLVLTVVVLATAFNRNLIRAKTGRAFVAIRDGYLSAELIGVNMFKYRLYSFAISSFYVGVAGALWAHYINSIAIDQFTLSISIEYLAMIIIGGLGSIMGVFFGVFFIAGINEIITTWLGSLSIIFEQVADKSVGIHDVVFGLAIIFFLIFEPEGLSEVWRRIKTYWKLWPFSYKLSDLK